jgi:hypothetical protein
MQLAMTGSALWEPRADVWLGTHAEGTDSSHLGQHNESTCGLCSARTQASMPTVAVEALNAPRRLIAAVVQLQPVPASVRATVTLSRAPPSLPA